MAARQRSAQSIIEYSVLAAVVVLAIIVGGPFLINGINAHFKIMDNDVRDSFDENIKQAGGGSAAPCVCTPASADPSQWPGGSCHVNGCKATEREHHRVCSPLKCQPENACVADDSCCADALMMDCGSILDLPSSPNNQCLSREALDPSFSALQAGHQVKGRCLGSGGGVLGCAIGERQYKTTCGVPGGTGTKDAYGCAVDAACLPGCVPMMTTDNSEFCNPPDEDNPSNLPYEVSMRLNNADAPPRTYSYYAAADDATRVGAIKVWDAFMNQSACSTGRYCERYCTNCKVPNAAGTACIGWMCSPNAIPAGTYPKETPIDYLMNQDLQGTHTFRINVYAEDAYFVATCFDAQGNLLSQMGNMKLSPGAVSGQTVTVSGKDYNWAQPRTSGSGAVYDVSCDGAQAYVRVWAGAAANEDNPSIGYQVCQY